MTDKIANIDRYLQRVSQLFRIETTFGSKKRAQMLDKLEAKMTKAYYLAESAMADKDVEDDMYKKFFKICLLYTSDAADE